MRILVVLVYCSKFNGEQSVDKTGVYFMNIKEVTLLSLQATSVFKIITRVGPF